ncbi:Bpu10I family restriction endonuclease [Candidatus Woesearchaeota archaeon]|nr:Bpu10I family restriction endonuclease [Candidatus Woesearchaeota archaeon]
MTEDNQNLDGFRHGFTLNNKLQSTGDSDLKAVWSHYVGYRKKKSQIKILEDEAVRLFVKATNEYRKSSIKILESRKNSGQENLRSTILEEFFQHLFSDLIKQKLPTLPNSLYSGCATNSYVSLTFTPKSFTDIFAEPNPYIHTKDQDFVLGCIIEITVNAKGSESHNRNEVVIPIIAIECKTYLERNMLDSCAATARRLKGAMPYCLYIVASEYLKMEVAQPELTSIDEVFILCKASNGERLKRVTDNEPPHEIDPELVVKLFNMIKRHLNSVWWSPEDALKSGVVINRP